MLIALSLLALPFLTTASPVQPGSVTSIIAQPWASSVTVLPATTTFDGAISTGVASLDSISSDNGSHPLSNTNFAPGSGVSSVTSGCPAFATGGPSSHLGHDGTVTVSLPQASQVASLYMSVTPSGSPATNAVSETVVASPVSVGSGPAPSIRSVVSFSSENDSNSASVSAIEEASTYAESSRPTTTTYVAPSAFSTSGCYSPAASSGFSVTFNGSSFWTSVSSNATATATALLKQLAGKSDSSGAASTFGVKGAVGAATILGVLSAAALS